MKKIPILFLVCSLFVFGSVIGDDVWGTVSHGYVDNNGVKLHYATLGDGPLIVMVHGYPDFWYTWRHQMNALSKSYQVVAMDLRGYNRSDNPKGVENYTMPYLISDLVAVIHHFPQKEAVVIGHDWGGAIAWQTAIRHPELVTRLIVLSTPHPKGLFREITTNPEQQRSSQYARDYQKENAHRELTPEKLAGWVRDESVKKYYLDAFRRSDCEAMLNYYKAAFPKWNANGSQAVASKPNPLPNVSCPVLAIFGRQDTALLASGWNGTWDWIDNHFTLLSIPDAGHFVQQDAPDLVTHTILAWLTSSSESTVDLQ